MQVLYNQDDYVNEVRPNGGVLYIQNAAPDGPAAWLLSEVTDRLLRWIEDGFNTTRHTHDVLTWCNYMDQDGLRDAISSVMMGECACVCISMCVCVCVCVSSARVCSSL